MCVAIKKGIQRDSDEVEGGGDNYGMETATTERDHADSAKGGSSEIWKLFLLRTSNDKAWHRRRGGGIR